MRHSLYIKFLLGYLVFGILGFITISTLSSRLMYSQLVEAKTEEMYDQANQIASAYSSF